MPVEIIATITSIAGLVKGVSAAIKAIADAKDDGAASQAIKDAQQSVLDLQAHLMDLQGKAIGLQEDNRRLRDTVRALEDQSSKLAGYEVKGIGRGSAVVPRGKDRPLYCVTCYQKGALAMLSTFPRVSAFGSHFCSSCKARVRI